MTQVESRRGGKVLGVPKPKGAKKQVGWRIDAELVEYIIREGKLRESQTEVIENALRLDRSLSELLAGHAARLDAYAKANALTMRDHSSAVLVRLVLAGLDAHESRKR